MPIEKPDDPLKFLVSTNGGDMKLGQVCAYDPVERELTLIFESPAQDVARNLDNITVSPRGNRGRDVQPRRPVALRQRADAGDHVRDHRRLG